MTAFLDKWCMGAGNQSVTLSSTAVLLTVLKALEQSVRTSLFPKLLRNAHVVSPTCSSPPGIAIPNFHLGVGFLQPRPSLLKKTTAMSRPHFLQTQNDRHFLPSQRGWTGRRAAIIPAGTPPAHRFFSTKFIMPRPNSSRPRSVMT